MCQSKILNVIENFEGTKIETLKTVIFDPIPPSPLFTSSFFVCQHRTHNTYMQLESLIK